MLGADYFAGKTGEAEVAVARPALLGANGTSSQIGAAWFWERARVRRKAGRIRNEFFSDLPRRHGAKNPVLLRRSPLKISRFAAWAGRSP
jgi:hypothetical protein